MEENGIISIDADFEADAYQLIELPKDLAECIEKGENLRFVGEDNGDAFLSASTQTYRLKKAETSNTVLLSPCETWNGDINLISKSQSYIECIRTRPKTLKLRLLLEPSALVSTSNDNIAEEHKYNSSRLLGAFGSSEDELRAALRELNAFKFNGHWRILDLATQLDVFDQVVYLIMERSWNINSIDFEFTLEQLGDVEKVVLKAVFDIYGRKNEDGSWIFEKDVISKFRAHQLFVTEFPTGNVSEVRLLEKWEMYIPDGIVPKLELLQGIAVQSALGQYIYCPRDRLSLNAKERFAQLFQLKLRWGQDELQPYLKDLTDVGITVGDLLLKHTRIVNDLGSELKWHVPK
eukprot:TRINITY_DN31604_c0_g1_i1.p1 TRINITY_DN31604_c0_g1~~TRINITY_DN31604_c0_g1_i1.p1  ORF type:complete len:372 (+),score=66.21 TRINITY_DN31604_c0_g1_i1:70-1116(+)